MFSKKYAGVGSAPYISRLMPRSIQENLLYEIACHIQLVITIIHPLDVYGAW